MNQTAGSSITTLKYFRTVRKAMKIAKKVMFLIRMVESGNVRGTLVESLLLKNSRILLES
jgi:hypothetical protein